MRRRKIMILLPGYQILEKLQEGANTILFRGYREADNQLVLMKIPAREHPPFKVIAQLKHEYELAKSLNLQGILSPYQLVSDRQDVFLVFENFTGIFLDKYIQSKPIQIGEFLKIARQLAEILTELHKSKIIHKDIQPKNILIDSETEQIKITDFSIASLLSREYQTVSQPGLLEGTLDYMSPEQTGRMNRAIDYRTDFYSLGVTFYQMLTGRVPFQANDSMELVHCHIAKQPLPPHALNPDIPLAVSSIVMKLLSKTAEDRYQSARGLKIDLETCLKLWQETGKIKRFILGQQDVYGKFQIPQKLYGREAEVATLMAAFERVAVGEIERELEEISYALGSNYQSQIPNSIAGGSPRTAKSKKDATASPCPIELMLVSGYAGIGKSSLVYEIHKPIAQKRGYFISGKFDQFKRNIPYAPLIQAFQELIRQILTESSEKIEIWKTKLLQLLGSNAQVIIDIIPDVELIIGSQRPVPQLPPIEAQNRFNLVFKQFVHAFTQKEHPLVLFLDDLQWADSASLKLIQLILTDSDSHYLFAIGAYRDNEVSPVHPLMLTLESLKKMGAVVNQIILQPIDVENLNRLVADSLTCSKERAKPLSEQVFQKTRGNPFFAIQFLRSLYDEELLEYNANEGYWQCDIAKVKALAVSDNVVEFMAHKLQKLPDNARNVLKMAACIGYQFDLETLSLCYEKSLTETASDLWAALQEGLVLPLSEIYKFFKFFQDVRSDNHLTDDELSIDYKFLHDRVQQATYSLIPDVERKAFHLKIGRLLLKNTEPSELEEKIFEIVNNLNQGIELITNQSDKNELASLNLMAARKAKLSTAYEATLKYSTVGLELLRESSWQSDYDLTMSLHLEALEAAYLNTKFERANQLSEFILKKAKTLLEKVKVYELKIPFYYSQNQVESAIDTALQVLHLLGVFLPQKPSNLSILRELISTKLIVGNKRIEQLASLPEMTDPYKLAAMRLLLAIGPAAANANPALYPLVIFKIVKLSLQYGNSSLSAYGYCMYGMLLSMMLGDINSGYQFGQLGERLLQQFQAKELQAKVNFLFNIFIRHWREHIRKTIEPLLEAFQTGLETGDIEYACYSLSGSCQHLIWSGEHLESVAEIQFKYLDVLQKYKQEVIGDFAKPWHQFVLNLLDKSPDRCRLIGDVFDEEQKLPVLQEANNKSGMALTYLAKSMLLYLFNDYGHSVEYARLTENYKENIIGTPFLAQHNFYYSLALLGLYSSAAKREQKQYLKKVAVHQKQMKKWATYAPCNFQHKYELVEAETARVLGHHVKAMEYYDRAIQGARTQGYIQEEALANERAAEFYFLQGRETIAEAYLTQAYSSYSRWGARAKLNDLEERYLFLHSRKTDTNIPAISSDASVLDLTTVFKASQALSSEIVWSNLLEKLMDVLIENAGAERGVFIVKKDSQLLIKAEKTLAQESAVLQSLPVDTCPHLPVAMINYVERTQEYVVLNDAAREGLFTGDSYIISKQTKSILCLPIIHQGKLTGILYLENNLTAGAFTPERLEVLKLLTAQVSISIENAELYTDLQAYSQELQIKNTQLQQTNQKLEAEIADRKQVEAALRLSEERFRLAIDRIPDTFVIYDAQRRLQFVNSYGVRLSGYPEDALIGHTDEELFPPEVTQHYLPFLQQAVETRRSLSAECTITLPASGAHTIIVTYVPLLNERGEIHQIIGITHDITERKLAEEALYRREQEFKALVENSPDIIARFDRQMRHVYVNPAIERATGIPSCAFMGKTHQELEMSDELISYWQSKIQRVFDTAGDELIEFDLATPTGMRSYQTHIVPEYARDGSVEFVLGVTRDITDRKQAEAEIKQLNETLELKVAQRTAQLEATNRELDSFSYSVSHDLRAPLRHIGGFVNALTLQLDRAGVNKDLKVLHYLQVIRDSSEKMAQLIDGLLTLSRIGRRQLEQTPVNLKTLVERAIALVQSPTAKSGERAIEFEIGDLPTVMGDAALLQQVFSNLIDNAVKFSRDRHPAKIAIGTLQDGTLFIRDNGVGFDMNYADQLFGAFQRLHSQKAFEGTGIGLAIVQRAIHRHGGTIWAESQPDNGATFYFTLGQI
jgi:PAS domain S-box-containing protein